MIWKINKLKEVKFHESLFGPLVITLLINSKRMSNFIIVQSCAKRSPRKFTGCNFYPLIDSICKLYCHWQRYITILWQRNKWDKSLQPLDQFVCGASVSALVCVCALACVWSCLHSQYSVPLADWKDTQKQPLVHLSLKVV
jgi:hypothetical protein